jgi:tight adherence protein B
MDERNLVALLLVAAFVSAALMFWLSVHIVSNAVAKYREAFTEHAKMNLEQMFLFIDSGQLLTLNGLVIVGAAVIGYLVTGSWILALVFGALALVGPRVAFKVFRWRRAMNLRQQLPDAAMLVSGALRAGASAPTAIAQMAAEIRPPISQEFELFLREQRLGVGFDQALDNLEQRVDLEDMALFASAMRVSRETGGNLAETLERLADTLRQKIALEGKIRALTAQGKLQGFIVGMLPFALMFVLFKMEPEAMSRMFTTWYGIAVIGFIVVMEVIGGLIIKKIVTIDV